MSQRKIWLLMLLLTVMCLAIVLVFIATIVQYLSMVAVLMGIGWGLMFDNVKGVL